MIPDNVTLIVKAPNQQIEDQNVECQSSWTVRQLKGHLSQVYPSKPRTEEQKIIYSGQLLDDNTILKDVLRTYESQIAHTMHLVCAPNRRMPEPVQKPAPATVEPQEGLRRRNVENTEPPRPETRQNDQNHTVEMQNYISSVMNNYGRVPPYPNYNMGEGYLPVANDPESLAHNMMIMQQTYLQYMQHYANMWQNQQGGTEGTAVGAPGAGAAAAPPAAAPPAPEEEEGGRDWLDHLYAASRLAVLSSLVYLYGSGARLLLVLMLALAGYLHQIGFFRDLNLNPANQNQPANGNRQNQANANARPNNQPNRANNQANQANNQANQANNQANPVNNQANQGNVNGANVPDTPNAQNNHQSILAVTWMIFTSFFTSLIPEAQQ